MHEVSENQKMLLDCLVITFRCKSVALVSVFAMDALLEQRSASTFFQEIVTETNLQFDSQEYMLFKHLIASHTFLRRCELSSEVLADFAKSGIRKEEAREYLKSTFDAR